MMHRKATASCKNPGAALPNKQEMMLTVTDDSRPDFNSLTVFIRAAPQKPTEKLAEGKNKHTKQKCGALIPLCEKHI